MRKIWARFRYWFLEEQYPHDHIRWSRLLRDGLVLTILVVLTALIYQNIPLFQDYTLLFIRLPSVALLCSLFFTGRYFWRVGRNLKYGVRGLNNGAKTFLLILLALLALYGYQAQQEYVSAVKEVLDKFHFEYLVPIESGNISAYWESADLNPKNVNDKDVSEVSALQRLFYSAPEREAQSKEAFEYVNELRVKYQKGRITWDDRAYQLAVHMAKDMIERNYFDHTTPEGECANTLKGQFGFKSHEVLAENLGGMTHDSSGNPISSTSVKEAVDGWMESRGHRYNLLYDSHKGGAIGCYKSVCVFYGVHNDPYGLGSGPCTTGDEGLAFWNSIPTQPGEV